MHRHRLRAFVAGVGGGEKDIPIAIFAEGQFLRFVAGSVRTFGLGPGTTTINALATWGDTTGTQLLNTSVLLDNAGNMTQLVTLDGQDAPRITATLATATPTVNKLTIWASNSAPWKLDATTTIEVQNIDGVDVFYGVGGINGVDPARWVKGPLPAASTDNAIARWDGTTGRLIQDSAVTIDDSGNVTGVTTLNGQAPGNFVTGPASATNTAIARYNGTTGKLIQNSSVLLDGSGGIANVSTINSIDPLTWVVGPNPALNNAIARFDGSSGKLIKSTGVTLSDTNTLAGLANVSTTFINSIDPSTWVVGPASSTTNRIATFNGTTGKLIQDGSGITASGGALASVSTINGTAPSTWVVGPTSVTDNTVTRFDGTTGKLIQNSSVAIDDSANVTGVNTLNGFFPAEWLKGVLTFFGGSTGISPGYGLPKRASSYRVAFVAFVPVTFGDTTSTISMSMSSDDNNGTWQLHMPNSSAALPLGSGGTWPNPGTYANASFIYAATAVVPAGSGIYNLNLSISSSGSMSLNTGWQVWAYL